MMFAHHDPLCLFANALAAVALASSYAPAGDLDGVVLDQKLKPLPGVTVALFSRTRMIDSRTTETDGSYAFKDVPPEVFAIEYYHAGSKGIASLRQLYGAQNQHISVVVLSESVASASEAYERMAAIDALVTLMRDVKEDIPPAFQEFISSDSLRAEIKTAQTKHWDDGPLGEKIASRAKGIESYVAGIQLDRFNTLAHALADKQGQYAEAESKLRTALATALESNPQADTSAMTYDLGKLLLSRGKVDEAERYAKESLALRQRLLPAGDPGLAYNHLLLASCYAGRGDWTEAERQAQVALLIRERALGRGDPLVAECLQWMSYLKLMQGDKERALEYCQRARAVHDNVNRKDQQEAALLVHLARLYEQLDRRKEAGQLLREALLVRRQLLGEGDPLVIETLNEVAMNAVAQSNQVEADAAFRRILSEYEKSRAKPYSEVAAALPKLTKGLENYAASLAAEGRTAEANKVRVSVQEARLRRE